MNSNKPTTDDFAPHVRPTFLLRWNPEISSMTDEDWSRLCRNYPYENLNWSIYDYGNAHIYDTTYMMRVDKKHPGIVMKGFFESQLYVGEDWAGSSHPRHYCDIGIQMIMNADSDPYITLEELHRAIPEYDWQRGHSGVMLPEPVAKKLDALFYQWRADNQEFSDALYAREANVIDPRAVSRITNFDLFRKYCDELEYEITDDCITHDCTNIYCNIDYMAGCVKLGIYLRGGDYLQVVCHNPHSIKCNLNDREIYWSEFRVHLHPADMLHIHVNGIDILCDTLEIASLTPYPCTSIPCSI